MSNRLLVSSSVLALTHGGLPEGLDWATLERPVLNRLHAALRQDEIVPGAVFRIFTREGTYWLYIESQTTHVSRSAPGFYEQESELRPGTPDDFDRHKPLTVLIGRWRNGGLGEDAVRVTLDTSSSDRVWFTLSVASASSPTLERDLVARDLLAVATREGAEHGVTLDRVVAGHFMGLGWELMLVGPPLDEGVARADVEAQVTDAVRRAIGHARSLKVNIVDVDGESVVDELRRGVSTLENGGCALARPLLEEARAIREALDDTGVSVATPALTNRALVLCQQVLGEALVQSGVEPGCAATLAQVWPVGDPVDGAVWVLPDREPCLTAAKPLNEFQNAILDGRTPSELGEAIRQAVTGVEHVVLEVLA